MAKYTLLKQEGTARRGQFETVHGTVQTPVSYTHLNSIYHA